MVVMVYIGFLFYEKSVLFISFLKKIVIVLYICLYYYFIVYLNVLFYGVYG